jgi:hypothetical protein
MKELTKANVQALRIRLTDALTDADKLKDFNITVGNARYDTSEVTFKLTLQIAGAESSAQKELKQMAKMFKLDIDKAAHVQGKVVQLVEYLSSNRKYPYIMQEVGTDRRYKITPEQAHRWFALEE